MRYEAGTRPIVGVGSVDLTLTFHHLRGDRQGGRQRRSCARLERRRGTRAANAERCA